MADGDVHVFDKTISQDTVAKDVPRYNTDGLQYAETLHAYIDSGAANHETLPKAAARLQEMRVPIENASSILSVTNSIRDHVDRTRKMPVAAVRFDAMTTTAACNSDDTSSEDDVVGGCRCEDGSSVESVPKVTESRVVARRGPTFADRLAALSVEDRKVVLS